MRLKTFFIPLLIATATPCLRAETESANFYRNRSETYLGTKVEIAVAQLTPTEEEDKSYWTYIADTVTAGKRLDGSILVLIPKAPSAVKMKRKTYEAMVRAYLANYPYKMRPEDIVPYKNEPVPMQGTLVQYKSVMALLVLGIETIDELRPPEPPTEEEERAARINAERTQDNAAE